jgi:hypothetical protein
MKVGGVANRSVLESKISEDGYPDVHIQIDLLQPPPRWEQYLPCNRGASMGDIPRLPGLRLHQ